MSVVNVNFYLAMPLDRVRQGALHGVRLARTAWRQRDAEGAAKEVERIVEPGHQQEQAERQPRIRDALCDFQRSRKRFPPSNRPSAPEGATLFDASFSGAPR